MRWIALVVIALSCASCACQPVRTETKINVKQEPPYDHPPMIEMSVTIIRGQ